MLDKTFEYIAQEVQLKFEKVSAYTSHGPSIGAYREAIVQEMIENFVSDRFSVKTGFIFDPDTERSSQQIDLLIVDENYPHAYYLKTTNFVVAHKSAVVCAIEIKSSFTKSILKDISIKCNSVKELTTDISFLGFCFDCKVAHNGLPAAYKGVSLDEQHYAEAIIVLGRGTLLKLGEGAFHKNENDEPLHHRLVFSTTPDFYTQEIKLFLSFIMKACFERDDKNRSPFADFKLGISIMHAEKCFFTEPA